MFSYTYILLLMMMIPLTSLVSEWSWVVDFSILNLGTLNLGFCVFLEKENLAFVLTVFVIFTMVFVYSFSYLSEEVYLKRFLGILTLFASSMSVLIVSGNMFSSLIGWDGLGVTSLFLILFYYSKSAFKASTLTFLMNRVGDCFFILALAQVILLKESQICYSCSPFSLWIVALVVLTSITKSAQIPFSTWLPAAMEAPTPVSALVHSSTLVTAGIYLLYRYSVLWVDSSIKNLLLILSVGTCFMAALSALVENDLKKLIALSTLSQLGFIMFSFSLGLLAQGFMHMLMHAYFKALLFMCAGLIIHSFKGSQSILDMSLSMSQSPLLMTIMSCSLMSMSGLPFLSGFYSKDSIVDSLKSSQWSTFVYMTLILSFLCTVMYSIRVTWYLLNSSSGWHSMSGSDISMIKPMIPLAVLACAGGGTTSWVLMESEMFVESSKLLILILLVTVSMTYWWGLEVKTSHFLEKKWNLSLFNSMLSSFFFQGSLLYKHTSDLLGIPEVINKSVKVMFNQNSVKLVKTMVHYSGSLEFLVFLVLLLLLL